MKNNANKSNNARPTSTNKVLTLDVALGVEMPELALPVPEKVRAQLAEGEDAIALPEGYVARFQLREPSIIEQRTMMQPIEKANNEAEFFDAITDLLMKYAVDDTPRAVVHALVSNATRSAISQIITAVQIGELPDPKQHQRLLIQATDMLMNRMIQGM